LTAEGLSLDDLKARILKKAYLSRGKRALLLFPQDTSISPPEPDDRFPGRNKFTLAFSLPRGSYATLVVKAAAA
jgi:tRNA pseudouridine13 synthase